MGRAGAHLGWTLTLTADSRALQTSCTYERFGRTTASGAASTSPVS